MTAEVHIDDITFYRRDKEWRDVVYRDTGGEMDLPSTGGTREAALLIEVAVDGCFTIVSGQQVTRVVLERVVEDVQYLIERLDAVFPGSQSRGRCLDFGDWGRCDLEDGHGGEHNFPTEEEYDASRA